MASPMILIPSASCKSLTFSASLSFLSFSISSKNLLDLASSSGSLSLSFEDKGSRSVTGGNKGLGGCGDGAADAGVACLDGFLDAVLFRVRGFSVCVPDIGSSANQDNMGGIERRGLLVILGLIEFFYGFPQKILLGVL